MKNCLFCKIIKGKLPGHKFYEDENVIALLDLFPNTEGQTLVINKKHYPSDYTKMPEAAFKEFTLSVKRVTHILKKKLGVNRVAVVIEGTGVDHIHAKLYPLHGLGKEFKVAESKKTVYYKKYPGFIDTKPGQKASDEDLARIVNTIKGR